jgi:hypothetical protein
VAKLASSLIFVLEARLVFLFTVPWDPDE